MSRYGYQSPNLQPCQTSSPPNILRSHHRIFSGCTLIELLVILWILAFALTGAVKGMRFASPHGPWWSLLGTVLGFIAGIIVAIVLVVLLILICQLISNFCKWYRPFPPRCPDQTCRPNICEPVETPLRLRKHIEGIAHNAYRCKCGNLYSQIGHMTLNTRWVRILPDNTILPCLKHTIFCRWKADSSDEIEIPADHDDTQYPIDICTTKTLKPTQEAIVIFVVLSAIFSIALILVLMLMPWPLGKTILSSPIELVILFGGLSLIIASSISVATWEKGRFLARSIQADEDSIRIQRFNGKCTQIEWAQITSAKKTKDPFSPSWIFKTPHAKTTVNSEGLLGDDWQLVTDYIISHT